MAFESKNGKQKFGNRMKANRYDRAHEGEPKDAKPEGEAVEKAVSGGGGKAQGNESKGPRAEAHGIEGFKQASEGEQVGEQAPNGAAESGDMVAKEHGPAHEVHITHDHMSGQHHVHSVHQDGHQNHAVHASPEEAHMHAKAAAGIPGGMKEKDEGEYPEGHHSATANGEDDEWESEPL